MLKKFVSTIICLLVLVLCLVGCGESKPEITINENNLELNLNEEKTIDVNVLNYEGLLNYQVASSEIVEVKDGKVVAKAVGTTTIKIYFIYEETEYSATLNVTVLPNLVSDITLSGKDEMEIGETQQLTYEVLPNDATNKTVVFESSDNTILEVSSEGLVEAKSAGKATISVKGADQNNVVKTLEITVIERDSEKPVITINNKKITVNYNENINLLDGVVVTDNKDKNLTMTIDGDVDNKKFGTYIVKYTATDSSGNTSDEVQREYEVVWDYPVTFIGHAGSYYGIMNTEEAFLKAVDLGYQAIECDVKQTSDGIFVTCHDDTFAGISLANTTYSELKNVEATVTRGGISYTSKICTLERYLTICKENNVKAVVELKSSKGITNTDQSRMKALMDLITECDMLNDVIFLGSQYNCLIWVKENGYEYIPCQYLVNSLESRTIYERCLKYNFDVSFNIEDTYSNSIEWIKRYQDSGIKVACFTFSQYSNATILQSWLDKGVDFVTCDRLLPSEVTLPKYVDEESLIYTVKFLGIDNTVLKEVKVAKNGSAASPLEPILEGYTFVGWDKEYNNIEEDTVVNIVYSKDTYEISYNLNNILLSTVPFESKSAFIDEFYGDFFSWIEANVDKISSITKSGDTYTMVLNSTTITFKNKDDLQKVDKYDFEKTLSNLIYKPVTRVNDNPVEPEEDENYFLNSSSYRIKYRALDQYFLNACVVGYPAYNRTYTPTSVGKIQIFFRFQQWVQGTNIASFNTLPHKTVATVQEQISAELPTTPISFTIEDEVILPALTCANATFLGWYLTPDCTGEKVEKIEKGTAHDIQLYAKWEVTQ